jgi:hypothetical protein
MMQLDKRHLAQIAFPVLYQCLFAYLLFIAGFSGKVLVALCLAGFLVTIVPLELINRTTRTRRTGAPLGNRQSAPGSH